MTVKSRLRGKILTLDRPIESARRALAGRRLEPVAVAAALGAYAVFDLYFQRVVPAQLPVYAALFVLSAGVVVSLLTRGPVNRKLLAIGAGVVAVFSLTLLRIPSQNVVLPRYVIGDVAVYSLLGIYMAGAAASWPGRDWTRPAYLVLSLSAFGSMLASTQAMSGARFEPPATLVIASIGALILHYRGLRQALVIAAAGLAVLMAALASGNRTSLGLLLGAVVIGSVCRLCSRRTPPPGINLSVVGPVVGLGIIFVVPLAVRDLGDWRAVQAPPSATDSSLHSRVTEARDALGEVKDGGGLALALGFGPGASYVPEHSTVAEQNRNEHGTIHSIHIAPAMLLYRYGLIGVLGFVLLTGLAFRAAWFFTSPEHRGYGLGEVTLMLSMPLFLMQMLLVNVTVNPVWAYTVSGSVLILTNARMGNGLAQA